MNPSLVEISGDGLTIAQVASVARLSKRVELVSHLNVREKISASRRLLEKKLAAGEIIYGVNTGFGGNARYLIPSSEISKHQENMFQFLACGVGTALPEDTVRAAMLLRANALAKGFSGVRLVIIEKLLDLLNKRITPVVPRYGSVGASGDLIPSAYIARALLGQGEVYYQGTVRPADRTLADARMEPLRLEAKEALALVNGTTVMNGIGSLVIDDGAYLTASVLACVSLALEALGATDDPFKDAIHRAKNHPGQITAAAFCRELLSTSGNVRNLDLLRAQLAIPERRSVKAWSAPRNAFSRPIRCAARRKVSARFSTLWRNIEGPSSARPTPSMTTRWSIPFGARSTTPVISTAVTWRALSMAGKSISPPWPTGFMPSWRCSSTSASATGCRPICRPIPEFPPASKACSCA